MLQNQGYVDVGKYHFQNDAWVFQNWGVLGQLLWKLSNVEKMNFAKSFFFFYLIFPVLAVFIFPVMAIFIFLTSMPALNLRWAPATVLVPVLDLRDFYFREMVDHEINSRAQLLILQVVLWESRRIRQIIEKPFRKTLRLHNNFWAHKKETWTLYKFHLFASEPWMENDDLQKVQKRSRQITCKKSYK